MLYAFISTTTVLQKGFQVAYKDTWSTAREHKLKRKHERKGIVGRRIKERQMKIIQTNAWCPAGMLCEATCWISATH